MFLFGKTKNEKASGSRKAGSWKTTRLIAEGVFCKIYEAEKEEAGSVRKAVLKVVTLPADNRLLQSFQDELALMDELKGGQPYREVWRASDRESWEERGLGDPDRDGSADASDRVQ